MNFKDLKQLCLSHGFTNVVPLACDTIELKPEVRQMCASDSTNTTNAGVVRPAAEPWRNANKE